MSMLIRLVSEKCPYCGSSEGKCSVQVQELLSLATFDMKTSEKAYEDEFFGKKRAREAYFVQAIVCVKRKKR